MFCRYLRVKLWSCFIISLHMSLYLSFICRSVRISNSDLNKTKFLRPRPRPERQDQARQDQDCKLCNFFRTFFSVFYYMAQPLDNTGGPGLLFPLKFFLDKTLVVELMCTTTKLCSKQQSTAGQRLTVILVLDHTVPQIESSL